MNPRAILESVSMVNRIQSARLVIRIANIVPFKDNSQIEVSSNKASHSCYGLSVKCEV